MAQKPQFVYGYIYRNLVDKDQDVSGTMYTSRVLAVIAADKEAEKLVDQLNESGDNDPRALFHSKIRWGLRSSCQSHWIPYT